MVWSGTSDRGNSGVPNMKLPKKLHWTPLAICSNGLNKAMGARPPKNPARRARPPRRTIPSESRTVLLPMRSNTASLGLGMRRERSEPSSSTRCAPRASNFEMRSRLRVVAVTWAPACAAMFRAAWPSADVAPRMTSVWPARRSRLRYRQVHAVAYDSGIAASSSHESPD